MPAALEVLRSKRAWSPRQVEAVFTESGDDDVAVKAIAEIAEPLDLVGTPTAYKTVLHVFQHLVDHPAISAEPLVPLMKRMVEHEPFDPDGTRRFSLVRCLALQLLARRKDRAAHACLVRWLDAFPVERDTEYAVSLADVMCGAAKDLGDASLAPRLRSLLDTLIQEHRPSARKVLMERAHSRLKDLG